MFLGYWVKTYSGDRVIKVKCGPRHTTRKSVSQRIQLHIPPEKPQQFCVSKHYGNYDTMKAAHKRELAYLSDAEIILAYNGELRGLANYYALAVGAKGKLHKLARMQWISLLKTLANKHKTSVNHIANCLKQEDGYALIVKGEQQTRTIRVFRLKDLTPPEATDPQLDSMYNSFRLTLSHSELIRRLNAEKCEYCETTDGPFEVHHIRKMKDVAQGKACWQKLMIARNRKTLILCLRCHQQLHAGTLPDQDCRRKRVKGEPCAVTSRQHGSVRG
jgi:AI2M/AI1M-like HNH endonuclease/type II intron maturase